MPLFSRQTHALFLKIPLLDISFFGKPVLTNFRTLDQCPSYAVLGHRALLVPYYLSHQIVIIVYLSISHTMQ